MKYELKRINVHRIADSESQRDYYLSDGYELVNEIPDEDSEAIVDEESNDTDEINEEADKPKRGRPPKSTSLDEN